MLVSIITATYNSAATITNTLQSVASQTYTDIEHIIIDNESTDETLSIAKEFPHIKKIISEPDKGIFDAMNKGIKQASGDIIAILNSDDFFAGSTVIKDVVNAFQKSHADIVYGNLYYVKKEDVTQIVRFWKSSPYKNNAFITGWHPPHPAFFVKKNVYEKYGVFKPELSVAADFELMLRFIERYKVSTFYLDEVLVKMRTGGNSNKSIKNIIEGSRDIKKSFLINGIKYKFYYPLLRFAPKLIQFIKK